MSYSKGPLRISGPSQGKGPYDDGGDYAIIEPGSIIIGEAFRRADEDVYRDAEANARLWAKAPDLLAALEALYDSVMDLREAASEDAQASAWIFDYTEDAIRQARAALTGARGAEGA